MDDIFDDIVAEEIESIFFSLFNASMVCVMCVSAYLWFKLDKLESN